nr:hypothetical protein [Enterococcus sp. DIV0849a]
MIEKTFNSSIIFTIVFFVIVEIIFQIFSGYMLQRLGISLVYQLREKVISQILNLKKEEIDNFSSGNLASMLTNDTSA